jgi:hypothetical protein
LHDISSYENVTPVGATEMPVTWDSRRFEMKTITIEVRSVFGVNKAYPVCANAQTFAEIAGTKTLTYATLRHIIGLGYTIEVRASCPGFTAVVMVSKISDLPAVQ